MAFKKILCPIDFSVGAKHAMRVAIRMANEADAELVIAHAWHMPAIAAASEFPLPADSVQRMIADEERGLEQAVREARELGAKRVTPLFLTGLPWHEIVETAQNDRAFDLIVIGTRGRTGFARVLLGSVAENVIRHAPCPVLATRTPGGLVPFDRILLPLDFSESSLRAAKLAAGLAKPQGRGITLLHVIEVPITYSGDLPEEELLEEIDRQASQHVARVATMLRETVKAPIETRIRIGHPGAQILGALDEDGAFDLIVMGSHGRTGIRRVLLGSVAEKVVRHAPCPVLVERAP
jgi:nucleotide-binding universal stress UspA family protein